MSARQHDTNKIVVAASQHVNINHMVTDGPCLSVTHVVDVFLSCSRMLKDTGHVQELYQQVGFMLRHIQET